MILEFDHIAYLNTVLKEENKKCSSKQNHSLCIFLFEKQLVHALNWLVFCVLLQIALSINAFDQNLGRSTTPWLLYLFLKATQ